MAFRKNKRETYGITDGLIRMHVGIENVQDIIADWTGLAVNRLQSCIF
jgi:cystathionine beta-lyase/cystathionine gamma-synthase